MIKKLQKKFILIVMGSLTLVMLLLVGAINLLNLYRMDQRLGREMKMLLDNQGEFPEPPRKPEKPKDDFALGFHINEETRFRTRYFVVKMDKKQDITQIDPHIAALTSDEIEEYATAVMDSSKKNGYKGIYKYAVAEQPYGYLLIFIDCEIQIQGAIEVLITSAEVAVATMLLVFCPVFFLSGRAIKPIIENMEKQKQFITDAGHEIKTPLAIISANTDVLELTGGGNEWLTSIRNQTVRLNKLVKNLLTLSKMDEDSVKINYSDMDLSETVMEIAGAFEAVARNQKKTFTLDIQPDLTLHGDEGCIQQLVSILVDNAIKYSKDEGMIKLTLVQTKKGVKLEVYNTVEKIDRENLNKLFDRFYRADLSRSRETGGYGIGLSIAKSIVEAHDGKISVKSEDNSSICFTVVI